MKNLNLRELPTRLINLDSQPDRLVLVSSRLNELGIDFDKFSAIPHEKGIIGCGLSHYNLLSQIEPGTLVLEDDILSTEAFTPMLELPEEVDAVYLGVSNYGYVRPYHLAVHEATMCSQYNKDYKRVYNMCSTHSILYVSRRFIEGAANITANCLERNIPFDLGLASIQRHYNILTPNKPFFFQEPLPQFTKIVLDASESL